MENNQPKRLSAEEYFDANMRSGMSVYEIMQAFGDQEVAAVTAAKDAEIAELKAENKKLLREVSAFKMSTNGKERLGKTIIESQLAELEAAKAENERLRHHLEIMGTGFHYQAKREGDVPFKQLWEEYKTKHNL